MKMKMRSYVEIVLIIFLVMLMYIKSPSVSTFATSILGKIALVIAVVIVTSKFGRNAGVLSAVIVVLLLHSSREGAGKRKPPPSPGSGLSPFGLFDDEED